MNNSIITIPFHNQSLFATLVNDVPHVAMKPICESIGLNWSAQLQKIKRHPVLSKGMVMITTPSNGGIQEMIMLPIKMLNGWLFGVDSSRVKSESKDVVIAYQEECFDVLANHFMPQTQYGLKELPTLPAPRAKTYIKGGLELHQQDAINDFIKERVAIVPEHKRKGITVMIYSAICIKFDVKGMKHGYKNIAPEQFDNIIQLIARLPIHDEKEMLFFTQDEFELIVAERVKAIEGELLPKTKPVQHNSINLTFDGDEPQKLLVSVGPMGTRISKLLPDEMVIKKDQFYIMERKDKVSAGKLVLDYIPSEFLPYMIEVAGQRLGRIEAGKPKS